MQNTVHLLLNAVPTMWLPAGQSLQNTLGDDPGAHGDGC